MNVVLVGGAGDGTRIVLPDGRTRHDVAVLLKRTTVLDALPEHVQHEVHHYSLFRLHPVTRAVVFAHDELTPMQILERLLEHYAPPKQR